MDRDPVVIVGMARTIQGNLLGELKEFTAPDLGALAIRAALERAQLPPEAVNEVFMGCVLSAGLGQAPARQAALKAGLPTSVGCTTLNKMCGSGMKAVMLAQALLYTEPQAVIIAGGMESMSQAPYLLAKARTGYRLGHGELWDHTLRDGLEDAYEKKHPMGYFAERCAKDYGFSRAEQDAFALVSFERARKAILAKQFVSEITPLILKTPLGEKIISVDERPNSVNLEKMPKLKPIFDPQGSITAGNSSSISDGAAALVLMRLSEAKKRGLPPLARLIAGTSVAKAPADFPTAPIDALQKLLRQLKWSIADVDLFEINEAFAVVPLVAMRELGISHEKLNILGGACALGHPIGASGARILVTLINALQLKGLKRGLATLCIGGGEATALALELL